MSEEILPSTSKPKTTSSVHDIKADKPPFGSRFLTDESEVWTENAWDHVPPPDDQDEIIAASLAKQRTAPVPEEDKSKYNDKPARHWDNFYKANSSNFFRDRKWLHNEFPELVAASEENAGQKTIVEIGCGAGNAVFPLLSANRNPCLILRAHDYSSHAIKVVQTNPLYKSPPIGTITASVWDLTSETLPPGTEPGSADIVMLIFVLSALHPEEWARAVRNIYTILKPNGLVLLRDYGRHDLTQLRFKTGRLLDDNFYIRGDKTRVYFFELDELALLFTGSPAPSTLTTPTTNNNAPQTGTESPESLTLSTRPDPDPNPDPSVPSKGSPIISPDGLASSDRETTSEGEGEGEAQGEARGEVKVFSSVEEEILRHDGQGQQTTPTTNEQSNRATLTTLPPSPSVRSPLSSREGHLELHRDQHVAEEGEEKCESENGLFAIEQLGRDHRLLVNRFRKLKMYRVWMQGKFRKVG